MRKGGSIEMKAATAWRRRELPADRPDQAKRGDDSVAFVVHAVDEVGVVHAQSCWFCCRCFVLLCKRLRASKRFRASDSSVVVRCLLLCTLQKCAQQAVVLLCTLF